MTATLVFAFGSAILAAGSMMLAAIAISWVIRYLVPIAHRRKTRSRRFTGDESGRQSNVEFTEHVQLESPFHVLGFTEVPSSFADVRTAFLRESSRTHPDANLNDETAAARFDQIRKAYEQIGSVELFRAYLQKNPPEKIALATDGGEARVVSIDEFSSGFHGIKGKWMRAEARRVAEMESLLITSDRSAKLGGRFARLLADSPPRRDFVLIDDVIFKHTSTYPQAQYFKLYGCLLCVDDKESFYRAIRFLLDQNGFRDTFSDIKSHGSGATFIGDLPGTFIFPKTIRVLISHDDLPAKLFTRLWDLGLYRGPNVLGKT